MGRKDAIRQRVAMSAMERRVAEATGVKPISRELLPYSQGVPNIDISDDDIGSLNIEYSIFDKEKDFVIGGPLGESMKKSAEEGKLAGRWFADWRDALLWAKEKYGARLKGRKPSEPGDTYRWAIIVRKELPTSG